MVSTKSTHRPAGQPEQKSSSLRIPEYKTDIFADIQLAQSAESCRVTLVSGHFVVGKFVITANAQDCFVYFGDGRKLHLRIDQILCLTDFVFPANEPVKYPRLSISRLRVHGQVVVLQEQECGSMGLSEPQVVGSRN